MQELCRVMPWPKDGLSASEILPGGDFPHGMDAFRQSLHARFGWIAPSQLDRYVRYYGTRSNDLLAGVQNASDLGRCFGADLTQREVDFLVRSEWAVSAEDIIWRRTKLGLRLTPAEVDDLSNYLAQV
jgi:glycerol-3-phosphate dehydrogenase